jgi:uncharacterized protein (DUF2336 family)
MTGQPPTELETLESLARDKTAAGRNILTATISDLFFAQSKVLTDRERALMSEILRKLIADVELSVRQALAERLAELADPPHELILTLARDEIDVARPILLRSNALQDLELIEIIRHRGLEHQMAIALRRSLSEDVSDALVSAGDADIIRTLLLNPSARISLNTMEYLVEQSRRFDIFQEPLLHREEMTPTLARRMYEFVSQALRDFIMQQWNFDPGVLDPVIAPMIDVLVANQVDPIGVKADELAASLAAEHALTPELMVAALKGGEVALFIAMFARLCGVAVPVVRRMLFEAGGDALCIACKASGIAKPYFASIYLMSRGGASGASHPSLADMAGLLALYDRVSESAAISLLQKWQNDPAFLDAMWQTEPSVRPLLSSI